MYTFKTEKLCPTRVLWTWFDIWSVFIQKWSFFFFFFWMESVISASPTGQLGKVKELKVTQLFLCTFFVCLFIVSFPFFCWFVAAISRSSIQGPQSEIQVWKKSRMKNILSFFEVWLSSRLAQTNVVQILFFLLRYQKKQTNKTTTIFFLYFRLKRRILALGVCLQCGEVSPWCLPTSLSASPCL